MSRIRADRVTNKEGTGAPLFPNGIRVVGLTSLSNVVAGVTTFTSDVSIGGTLTYEDVTNIDSVGMVTARTGIKVLAGGINAVGVVTGTSFSGGLPITSGANNRVITASSASALNGEANLTFDGTKLNITTSGAGFRITRNSQYIELDGNTGNGGDQALATSSAFRIQTGGVGNSYERLRIGAAGQIGLSGANYGTSGQVMTSQGGSAAPQWADAGGGAWELLQSASNPNTSAVDFVGLTTTYAAYKVQFMGANINSSNSRNMRCKVYLNGALQSGNNYRIMSQYTAIGNNTSYGYGGTWTSIPLSGQTNSNSRGYNGEIIFPMKLRTTGSVESLQAFYGTCVSEEFGNTIRGYCEGSYSNLLTGIRFDSPDNYNVTDGQFYLYGLTRT
jgi:hypothetical protein